MKFLVALFLFLAFSVPSVILAEEEEIDLPATGRLAGTAVSGYGHTGFEGVWGGENLSGDSSSPISASINRDSKQEWMLSITNNSEDTYKLQLRVKQLNNSSKTLKTNPVSVTLKGGEAYQRPLTAHILATHAEVNLTRWNRIEKQATRGEIQAKIDKKKEEIAELEAQLASSGQ